MMSDELAQSLNLLHFCDGDPFGVQVFSNQIVVQCPTCGLWSSLPKSALILCMPFPDDFRPTIADEVPFIICGHRDCRQEFTVRMGVTTLPVGRKQR